MCIILIGKITKEMFQTSKATNPDGFSVFSEATGLQKDPSNEVVNQAIGQFGIWHFRIGTSGTINKKDTYNIHPFEVCQGDYLLYHNGILGSGKDKMSDTHALADMLEYTTLETVKTVLQSLSSNNRFVLVNAKNPNEFYIYGEWVADAGVLMSHRLYTPRYVSGSWDDDGAYVPYKYRNK